MARRYPDVRLVAVPPGPDDRPSRAIGRRIRTVTAVLAFEALPLGGRATHRALVRWRDGTEGEALRWYEDEIRVTEGDLIGRTAEEIRRLHFDRDRAFLQSPDPSGG